MNEPLSACSGGMVGLQKSEDHTLALSELVLGGEWFSACSVLETAWRFRFAHLVVLLYCFALTLAH